MVKSGPAPYDRGMGQITVFISYQYPWESPAAARRLIEKHGHLQRLEELEDAENVIVRKL